MSQVERVNVKAFQFRGTNFPSPEKANQCAIACGCTEAAVVETAITMRKDHFDANQQVVTDPSGRWVRVAE